MTSCRTAYTTAYKILTVLIDDVRMFIQQSRVVANDLSACLST